MLTNQVLVKQRVVDAGNKTRGEVIKGDKKRE